MCRVMVVLGNGVGVRLVSRFGLLFGSNVCGVLEGEISGEQGRQVFLGRHVGRGVDADDRRLLSRC